MMVYYLQQMASASNTYGVRLLDYLTIHAYVAGILQRIIGCLHNRG